MKLEKKLTIYILILSIVIIASIQFIFLKNTSKILEVNKKHTLSGYAYALSKDDKIRQNLLNDKPKEVIDHINHEWDRLLNLNSILITDKFGKVIIYKNRTTSSPMSPLLEEEKNQALKVLKNTSTEYFSKHPKEDILKIFVPIIIENKHVGMIGIEEKFPNYINLKKFLFIDIIGVFFVIMFLTYFLSNLLAKNIKSQIFGYEPHEIAEFYTERQLIFDTISDEIITIDSTGKITKRNKMAQKKLQLEDELVLREFYREIISTGEVFNNREYLLTSGKVFISSLIISNKDNFFDILFIIKPGEAVKKMAREITGITQVIDSMRAHVHEFKNKIHVISGLLRLEEYDELKKYVSTIKSEIDYENNEVEGINDPIIRALLLTKINLAKEKRITLKIDEDSNLMRDHKNINSDDLIIIIGNLIENAMESFNLKGDKNKEIHLYCLEDSNKIFIEVRDNGAPIINIENIFQMGVSSKGEGRGSGLALIKNLVSIYKGKIDIKTEEETKYFYIELIKEEI